MKISSQQVGTGKLGNAVYSQNAGVCIARQYNPNVSNPSTESQVEKRSAFKLLSQLSAAMKSDIAIRKNGLQTPRNQFMSINYAATSVSDNVASINLNLVQLTKSNRGLGDFQANRAGGTAIVCGLVADESANIDRMVYAAYIKQVDGTLVPFDSKVVSTPGNGGTFEANLKYTDQPVVILGYGIKVNTSGASAAFGNLKAPTAEQVAKLIATSSEAASGSSMTKTKGMTMLSGETSGSTDDVERFLISVSASGNGSVAGGGRYAAGEVVTLTATPDAEASFVAWHRNSKTGEILSTNANYQFTATEDIVIVGEFQGGPTPKYNINLSADPAAAGTVSGGGQKDEGSSCTVVATPASGKVFQNWTENGNVVSTSASYTFTVERARTLVAHFGDQPASVFSNMTVNSAPWNADTVNTPLSVNIAGTFSGSNATHVVLSRSATKPTSNITMTNPVGLGSIGAGGAFTLNTGELINDAKYWLCAIRRDEYEAQYFVAAYEYSLNTEPDSGGI